MKIIPLSSSANQIFKRIRSLHERQARQSTGLFLIEGEKVLSEALKSGIRIETVVARQDKAAQLEQLCRNNNLDLHTAPPQIFKSLVTTASPSPVVAIAHMPSASLNDFSGRQKLTLVVVENLQDPGNLGTIIRSALAFGADGIVLVSAVDPFNTKVVRSASGALFALPLVIEDDIETVMTYFKGEGIEAVALNPEAKESLADFQFKPRRALLIGNEGAGLSERADKLADRHVSIPIAPGVESLNAAVAASVVLFHISQTAAKERPIK